MDNARGALTLTKEAISSKYLLLHTLDDQASGELWRIVGNGFRVTRKETLERLQYPSPRQRSYLMVRIEKVEDKEFDNISWNFKNLSKYSNGRASAFPFTASLTELMKNKV
jgi:hypothetical protein